MNKVLKIMICLSLCVLINTRVYADETDRLKVDITSKSGESVLIKSGNWFYTALPVLFTLPEKNGDNYYSISTDGGLSFGNYVKMDTDNVMLYPDDKTAPDGRWQIRFANVLDGMKKDSEIYMVCFDVTPPVIDLSERGHFSLSDDTGIMSYHVKSKEDIADKKQFKDSEMVKTFEDDIKPGNTIRYGDEVIITCEDVAGNQSVLSYEYMIDEGVPQLTTEGISDGSRLGTGGKLRVKAKDNESESYVNYMAERMTGDEIISTSGYNLSSDTELSFDDDGKYKVVLYATDSAQNESGKQTLSFIVDRIAPTVNISGISDGVDIRTPAKVALEVEDDMYEDTEVYINLTRSTLGGTENIPISTYNLNAVHDIREVDIIADGEYLMCVSAKDGTGNVTEKTCRFRIDKTAPDISVTGIREGEITNEKSIMRFCAGEMFYDSTVMSVVLEKKKGDSYVAVSNDAQVMRSARDYVDITADGEGDYRLTCTASDRSGNTSQQTVSFKVDYTPPVISKISGYDGRFLKSFSLVKGIADYVSDASPFTAKTYLNDTEIKPDDVIIEEGKYILTVIAEDAASNASEESVSFIVDHTSPQVVLSGFDRNGNIRKGSVVKVGLLEADDTLESVIFNGRNILIDSDNTATIAVNEYGRYNLEIRAADRAGNVTDTNIGTECYMYGGVFGDYTVEEKTISAAADTGGEIDIRGLLVGLASVLSGTFGLTYRTYLSGK